MFLFVSIRGRHSTSEFFPQATTRAWDFHGSLTGRVPDCLSAPALFKANSF